MNSKESKLVEDFESVKHQVTTLSAELEAQIKYLVSLREAFAAMMNMFEPLVTTMRAGTSGFLEDPANVASAFDKVTSAASDRASAPSVSNPVPDSLTLTPSPQPPVVAPTLGKYEPMWKTIRTIMADKERFTTTEAGIAVELWTGHKIVKNRPQIVRNNLVRHPEAFRQNTDGTWTVIKRGMEELN